MNVQCASWPDFDRYRFPSKIPEYLNSGVPLALNPIEIDLDFADGEDCLIVPRNTAQEWEKLVLRRLELTEEETRRLTDNARHGAWQKLRWDESAGKVWEALLGLHTLN